MPRRVLTVQQLYLCEYRCIGASVCKGLTGTVSGIVPHCFTMGSDSAIPVQTGSIQA
jgi:hypothetical protein